MLLTTREQDVLTSVCNGLSTKETADALKLSPKTVGVHRVKVYKKLGVHNSVQCVLMALRLSLFHLPVGPRSG